MKVDTIETKYGVIEVEYSVFTKGFFVRNYPEKLEQVVGLKLLKSRDNSFSEFKKLKDYVRDLVNNAMIDFVFERKVIIYKLSMDRFSSDNAMDFQYYVCDESKKVLKYNGKENAIREYFVHDAVDKSKIGVRNLFGQITGFGEDSFVIIEYSEQTHEFFRNFQQKFMNLKESLKAFFDKDAVVQNIQNHISDKLLTFE